ncbi:hypothetical protein BGZ52_007412 [Haplosporangium bisporale]|nr:hypothetical protein BGZ52_007412 [Haplosporangium bisporale]
MSDKNSSLDGKDEATIIVAVVSLCGTLIVAAITIWSNFLSEKRKRLTETEKLVKKYCNPLLFATQDLQSRLWGITEGGRLEWYHRDDDVLIVDIHPTSSSAISGLRIRQEKFEIEFSLGLDSAYIYGNSKTSKNKTSKSKDASTFKSNGAITFRSNGAITFRSNGASTFRSNGAITFRSNSASTFRSNGASTFGNNGASTFRGNGASTFKSNGARSQAATTAT